jgi:hypothetical protein
VDCLNALHFLNKSTFFDQRLGFFFSPLTPRTANFFLDHFCQTRSSTSSISEPMHNSGIQVQTHRHSLLSNRLYQFILHFHSHQFNCTNQLGPCMSLLQTCLYISPLALYLSRPVSLYPVSSHNVEVLVPRPTSPQESSISHYAIFSSWNQGLSGYENKICLSLL